MRARSPYPRDRIEITFVTIFCKITMDVIDLSADLYAADSHLILPFWTSIVVTQAVGVR